MRKTQLRSCPLKERPESIMAARAVWAVPPVSSDGISLESRVRDTTCRQKKLHKSPLSVSEER